MNGLIKIIVFLLFIISTPVFGQNSGKNEFKDTVFTIVEDTVHINVKGRMTHAIKYDQKYFVVYEESVKWGYPKRWIYVISSNKIEKIIDISFYQCAFNFIIINDLLYIKGARYCTSLVWSNFFQKWIINKKVDDLFYEDQNYKVFYKDQGEWGNPVWFKNKKTKKEYIIDAPINVVNEINGAYYLSGPNFIVKIENPEKLFPCDQNLKYEKVNKRGLISSLMFNPRGYCYYYFDTLYNIFQIRNQRVLITSFVYQNEMFNIFKTVNGNYVAKISDNSIQNIQFIGNYQNIFYPSSLLISKKNKNEIELLMFNTNNPQCSGLIEIIDNQIKTTYLLNHTEVEPRIINTTLSDSIMIERLNYILSCFDTLKLCSIIAQEKKWYSFDETPESMSLGNCYNPNNYTIDQWKSYTVIEDSLYLIDLNYYGSKENDLNRVAIIEWYKDDIFYLLCENSSIEKLLFSVNLIPEKAKFLESYFTQKLGEPTLNNVESIFHKTKWMRTDGLIIELTYSDSKIELVIYKKLKNNNSLKNNFQISLIC